MLAVPEQLLSRLMLATQAGTLRLAVRSNEEQRLAKYWAGEPDSAANLQTSNRQLFQFNQLALGEAPVNLPASSKQTTMPRRAIEVIRGNQVTQQTP